jgi:hypothetical protein
METYCIKQGHVELVIRRAQWKKFNRQAKILCILEKKKYCYGKKKDKNILRCAGSMQF